MPAARRPTSETSTSIDAAAAVPTDDSALIVLIRSTLASWTCRALVKASASRSTHSRGRVVGTHETERIQRVGHDRLELPAAFAEHPAETPRRPDPAALGERQHHDGDDRERGDTGSDEQRNGRRGSGEHQRHRRR